MGLLRRMFGNKKPAVGTVVTTGGSVVSLMTMMQQQGGIGGTQRCGIDGRTFPGFKFNPKITTMDIGGYCAGCGAYRCPDHARFSSSSQYQYTVVCARCDSELQPGP